MSVTVTSQATHSCPNSREGSRHHNDDHLDACEKLPDAPHSAIGTDRAVGSLWACNLALRKDRQITSVSDFMLQGLELS